MQNFLSLDGQLEISATRSLCGVNKRALDLQQLVTRRKAGMMSLLLQMSFTSFDSGNE